MYQKMFTPGKIADLELKNRIFIAAHAIGLSDVNGAPSEAINEYYRVRAKGGAGLIISETATADPNRIQLKCQLNASDDKYIDTFRQIADAVHHYGTKIFAQIVYPGFDSTPEFSTAKDRLSSTDGAHKGLARAITKEEIYQAVEDFKAAALRVKSSGFDGIEIHGAHQYLIGDFLSPDVNKRKDEFGGSLENRARFLMMIIDGVKSVCGEGYPVGLRLSLEDYTGKKGFHADEGIKVCQMAESHGIDFIDVSASGAASPQSQSIEPTVFMEGWRKHLAKAVKSCVNIPVLCVAMIRHPAFAESLLQDGYADYVGSARAFIADPEWANKAKEGRECEIKKCIGCISCFDVLKRDGHIGCAINPEAGYESHLPEFKSDGNGRLVIVLGAGIGGLEAACTAAKRGFKVSVYEKSKVTGGSLRLAGMVPRQEKFDECCNYFESMARSAGAEIVLNKELTIEEIKALRPYAIIDATGSKPIIPKGIEGLADSPMLVTAPQVIRGEVKIENESVVIAGSGMTGLEIAEILCQREKNNAVVLIEKAKSIAPGIHGSIRNSITTVLDVNNVVYMLNRQIDKVGSDKVYFSNPDTGEKYEYPCDRIVCSLGVMPTNPYGDDLNGISEKLIKIGDAAGKGKILFAVHDGYNAAMTL